MSDDFAFADADGRTVDDAGVPPGTVRLALTGTPRSGNAWLRLLLGDAYACETLSSHSPDEVPWEALPPDVVLQMHQHADAESISMIEAHGFRVVVLARHPLDVLISILHFARHDPSAARWLDGEGGDETAIASCTPLDPTFLEYATGPRARTLLSLSREWWAHPGASRIRYEDLCANAASELQALVAKLSPPRASIEQVVRAHTLDRLRRSSTNQHVWQGRPGHWRMLLPPDVANTIAEAHRESFELFGYDLDPDSELDAAQALSNWSRIARPAGVQPLDWLAAVRATDAEDIRRLRAELLGVRARLNEERAGRTRIEESASQLRREVESLREISNRLQAGCDEAGRQAPASTLAGGAPSEEIDRRRAVARRLFDELEEARSRAAPAAASVAALVSSRSFRQAPFRFLARRMWRASRSTSTK